MTITDKNSHHPASGDTSPTITRRNDGAWTIVEINGPLHWPYAARLAEQLQRQPDDRSPRFQLSLLGVTSLDHTAIAHHRKHRGPTRSHGNELRIVATTAQCRRLPRTTGMHHMHVHDPD